MNQQKLREWILKQKYFSLEPNFDGMTAWELAGKIIKAGTDKTQDEIDLMRAEDLQDLKYANANN